MNKYVAVLKDMGPSFEVTIEAESMQEAEMYAYEECYDDPNTSVESVRQVKKPFDINVFRSNRAKDDFICNVVDTLNNAETRDLCDALNGVSDKQDGTSAFDLRTNLMHYLFDGTSMA